MMDKTKYLLIPFYKTGEEKPVTHSSSFYSLTRDIKTLILISFSKIEKYKKISSISIKDAKIIDFKGEKINIKEDVFWMENGVFCYDLKKLEVTETFYNNNVMEDEATAKLIFTVTEV